MDDVDPKKISSAEFIKRKTSYIYKDLQARFQIPWCIAILPNQYWANKIFNNNENSLELLKKRYMMYV